jgi:2-oxoglutarate ferredoxin oxidoreductase subunit gamma
LSRREIRIAGFGGQGVVLAGYIIGQAIAVFDKKSAAFTQNYGPESRGGSCTAEVVASEEPISYPYLTRPDLVVILSQDAYHKYSQGLPGGTQLIIDPDLVKPDPLDKHIYLSVPVNRIAREMGRVVVANIVLIGFLAAVSDFASLEALRKSVLASVPKGTGEFNIKAFEQGYNRGLEYNTQFGRSNG